MVYLSLSGGSVGERFDNSTFRYDNQSLVCRGRSQLPRQVPLQRSQQTDDTGEILWETMYILCLMPNCFRSHPALRLRLARAAPQCPQTMKQKRRP